MEEKFVTKKEFYQFAEETLRDLGKVFGVDYDKSINKNYKGKRNERK